MLCKVFSDFIFIISSLLLISFGFFMFSFFQLLKLYAILFSLRDARSGVSPLLVGVHSSSPIMAVFSNPFKLQISSQVLLQLNHTCDTFMIYVTQFQVFLFALLFSCFPFCSFLFFLVLVFFNYKNIYIFVMLDIF